MRLSAVARLYVLYTPRPGEAGLGRPGLDEEPPPASLSPPSSPALLPRAPTADRIALVKLDWANLALVNNLHQHHCHHHRVHLLPRAPIADRIQGEWIYWEMSVSMSCSSLTYCSSLNQTASPSAQRFRAGLLPSGHHGTGPPSQEGAETRQAARNGAAAPGHHAAGEEAQAKNLQVHAQKTHEDGAQRTYHGFDLSLTSSTSSFLPSLPPLPRISSSGLLSPKARR
ncbi:hypothetical protein GGR56DRAFT_225456 [Xylariaceae sp. FL0804]|nr:hypothetical protein GGR56DRAFT_225456 [Xylariaceae sp. FL0804]